MVFGIAQVVTRAGFKTIPFAKMTPGNVDAGPQKIETGFAKEVEGAA